MASWEREQIDWLLQDAKKKEGQIHRLTIRLEGLERSAGRGGPATIRESPYSSYRGETIYSSPPEVVLRPAPGTLLRRGSGSNEHYDVSRWDR